MQTDQLVGQVLGEAINSSSGQGPNTWLQRVLQACKQQRQHVILVRQKVALLFSPQLNS